MKTFSKKEPKIFVKEVEKDENEEEKEEFDSNLFAPAIQCDTEEENSKEMNELFEDEESQEDQGYIETKKTLKELLDRCDFKDVAQVMKKHYSEQATYMTRFKEAFDALRQLEPYKLDPNAEDYQKIILKYKTASILEKKLYNKDYYISANYCGADLWGVDLAKEVIVTDKLPLTDSEIVAHCLWELTYYGNQQDEEEMEEVCFDLSGEIDTQNPYAVASSKLYDKLQQHNKPWQYKYATSYTSNLEALKIKCEKKPKYFKYMPGDMWHKKIPKNRIKRMRDKKIELRIKKLDRMAKVEDAIQRLTTNTKSFTREELQYLFDTKLINEKNYRSWVKNLDQRVDYLIDLLSNYETTDFSKATHFLLMFKTSSKYPLSQKEIYTLQNFFSKFLPASANVRYGYEINDNLNLEIRLFLLCSY